MGAGEQPACINAFHGAVVGNNRDDDVGEGGDGFKVGCGGAAEFAREFLGGGGVEIINGRNGEGAVLEAAGHVCTHAADADEGNSFWCGRHGLKYGVESDGAEGANQGVFKCADSIAPPIPDQRRIENLGFSFLQM